MDIVEAEAQLVGASDRHHGGHGGKKGTNACRPGLLGDPACSEIAVVRLRSHRDGVRWASSVSVDRGYMNSYPSVLPAL